LTPVKTVEKLQRIPKRTVNEIHFIKRKTVKTVTLKDRLLQQRMKDKRKKNEKEDLTSPIFFSAVVGTEPRALSMLVKCSNSPHLPFF
jgi:hypothetical protein